MDSQERISAGANAEPPEIGANTNNGTFGTIKTEQTNCLASNSNVIATASSSAPSPAVAQIQDRYHHHYHHHQQQQPHTRNQQQSVLQQQQQQQHHKKQARRAFEMLEKNSFSCLVIGSRQTGKRTIVKCFVKLVNEFKLAAREYRREKILTKLMDCSERLQSIVKLQEEEQHQVELEQELAGQRRFSFFIGGGGGGGGAGGTGARRRSRLNSWLGGGAMGKFLNLPTSSKLRLHSLVPIPSAPLGPEANKQPRRNTAVDQMYSSSHLARDRIGRHSTREFRRTGSEVPEQSRLNCCNKSDFNINYLANINDQVHDYQKRNSTSDYNTVKQLQVPTQGMNANRSMTNLLSSSSTSALYKNEIENANDDAKCGPASRSTQILSPTRICINDASYYDIANQTAASSKPRRQSCGRGRLSNRGLLADRSAAHQMKIIPRRARQLVSLKEMNRRRIKIRFSTRRQLNDRYLEYMFRDQGDNVVKGTKVNDTSDDDRINFPDSIMVVYSINDRSSFDYVKSLLSQLSPIKEKQKIPLPIIVVANKIDLERAKVVGSEEGRLLAKRNGCKYMEISCTVGFKLDNLLVGLRTQLVLKHHYILNSILRGASASNDTSSTGRCVVRNKQEKVKNTKSEGSGSSSSGGSNIFVRFYKRYMTDNYDCNYDCDNFSKL